MPGNGSGQNSDPDIVIHVCWTSGLETQFPSFWEDALTISDPEVKWIKVYPYGRNVSLFSRIKRLEEMMNNHLGHHFFN